jgi:hypothetical protein
MADNENDVTTYIKGLNREAEQETEVAEHRGSFFEAAPDDAVIVRRAREFEDIEKHIVRREHWLPLVTKLRNEKGSGLRLLTLPGRHRIEVELYRKEGLLKVSGEEVGAVGYETEPATFGMLSLERPKFEMLENADLTVVLTEPGGGDYKRLSMRFPFDIINLDFTVPLATPSDGPYSKQLQAISSCFRLQGAQTDRWALFVTFRSMLNETSVDTVRIWSETVDRNMQNPQVKAAFFEKFNVTSATTFLQKAQHRALGEFAAKWIIDEAHRYGWRVDELLHVWYSRAAGYVITKLSLILRRSKDVTYTLPTKYASEVGWHVEDLIRTLKGGRRVDISAKLADYVARKPDYVAKLKNDVESFLSRIQLERPLGS